MHELSLLADLLHKIESVARQEQAVRVTQVTVKVGALCHLSPEHLCEHFARATQGSILEDALLTIEMLTDITDPQAQDLVLDRVVIEAHS